MKAVATSLFSEDVTLRSSTVGCVAVDGTALHWPRAWSRLIWHDGTTTRLFAADNGGTAAWTLSGGQLAPAWKNGNGGTSPVVADGLLFVYDPGGGLRIYDARSGQQLADLPSGGGHWNSPIVVDGMIALPEGNANRHSTSGVLDIWRVR